MALDTVANYVIIYQNMAVNADAITVNYTTNCAADASFPVANSYYNDLAVKYKITVSNTATVDVDFSLEYDFHTTYTSGIILNTLILGKHNLSDCGVTAWANSYVKVYGSNTGAFAGEKVLLHSAETGTIAQWSSDSTPEDNDISWLFFTNTTAYKYYKVDFTLEKATGTWDSKLEFSEIVLAGEITSVTAGATGNGKRLTFDWNGDKQMLDRPPLGSAYKNPNGGKYKDIHATPYLYVFGLSVYTTTSTFGIGLKDIFDVTLTEDNIWFYDNEEDHLLYSNIESSYKKTGIGYHKASFDFKIEENTG